MDSPSRSIVKAISYRVLGSLGTGLVVMLLSNGNWKLSAEAGIFDALIKVGLYFVHERIWSVIKFGTKPTPAPEYEI